MCLHKLEEFPPIDKGYQVKLKAKTGYTSVYYHNLEIQEIGKEYKAATDKMIETNYRLHNGFPLYVSGFHVFHELDDAKLFEKHIDDCFRRNSHDYFGLTHPSLSREYNSTIVKVKCGGRKITGWEYIGFMTKRIDKFKVTVCEKIKLLREV